MRRARWLLGTGLSILGWPLQVVALLLAPLVVVQPALAAGLLVLMFLAQRMLGEHAGRYEHLAMAAIVIGVIGAGLSAPPRSDRPRLGEPRDHARARSGSALASLLPYALRLLTRPPAVRDDGRRRARLRLERRRDEARLRRPRTAATSAWRPPGGCRPPPPRASAC